MVHSNHKSKHSIIKNNHRRIFPILDQCDLQNCLRGGASSTRGSRDIFTFKGNIGTPLFIPLKQLLHSDIEIRQNARKINYCIKLNKKLDNSEKMNCL